MSLTVRADRSLVRAPGGSVRYALVELIAPDAPSRGPLGWSLQSLVLARVL